MAQEISFRNNVLTIKANKKLVKQANGLYTLTISKKAVIEHNLENREIKEFKAKFT